MKYLLTFVRDQDQMYEGTEEEMRQAMEAWNEFNREAIEAGVLIANEALELPKTAKTVRDRATPGDHAITDGPFAETKEQLGGFCLIDCRWPRGGDRVGEEGPDAARKQDRGPGDHGPLALRLRELVAGPVEAKAAGLEPVAAADHLEHDLVGAGADAVEAGVAVGALDLVLLHVAVAAVDLDALVGDLLDHP